MNAQHYDVIDPLLVPFLYSVEEKRAQIALEDIVNKEMAPIMLSELRRQYGPNAVHEAVDINSEVTLQVVKMLQGMRDEVIISRSLPSKVIKNFRSYIRAIIQNAWIRNTRVQKQVCSLSSSRIKGSAADNIEETYQIDIVDPRCNVGSSLLNKDLIRRTWDEMILLPFPQRTALILNLRDSTNGENATDLLFRLGIAQEDEVAAALGMTLTEFDAITSLLPLDDHFIALRLGITRREVISLRLTARRRLRRRVYQ